MSTAPPGKTAPPAFRPSTYTSANVLTTSNQSATRRPFAAAGIRNFRMYQAPSTIGVSLSEWSPNQGERTITWLMLFQGASSPHCPGILPQPQRSFGPGTKSSPSPSRSGRAAQRPLSEYRVRSALSVRQASSSVHGSPVTPSGSGAFPYSSMRGRDTRTFTLVMPQDPALPQLQRANRASRDPYGTCQTSFTSVHGVEPSFTA